MEQLYMELIITVYRHTPALPEVTVHHLPLATDQIMHFGDPKSPMMPFLPGQEEENQKK
jgi:hypothetical protein